jgi:type VI secretion system protein ImpK
LTKPDRIDVDGKGPDVPIATNATPEGRAKNRRVEVMIGRTNE